MVLIWTVAILASTDNVELWAYLEFGLLSVILLHDFFSVQFNEYNKFYCVSFKNVITIGRIINNFFNNFSYNNFLSNYVLTNINSTYLTLYNFIEQLMNKKKIFSEYYF